MCDWAALGRQVQTRETSRIVLPQTHGIPWGDKYANERIITTCRKRLVMTSPYKFQMMVFVMGWANRRCRYNCCGRQEAMIWVKSCEEWVLTHFPIYSGFVEAVPTVYTCAFHHVADYKPQWWERAHHGRRCSVRNHAKKQ